jgi:hypothetical protein
MTQSNDATSQVGHNISGFDLGVLLNRMEFNKVGCWSGQPYQPESLPGRITIYILAT